MEKYHYIGRRLVNVSSRREKKIEALIVVVRHRNYQRRVPNLPGNANRLLEVEPDMNEPNASRRTCVGCDTASAS